MNYRNQNKPPVPRSPLNPVVGKQFRVSDASIPGRAVLSPLTSRKEIDVGSNESEAFEETTFTKEEVDALLKERFKGKKFDSKGKQEWMAEYLKKMKACVKWFQKALEDLVKEKDSLRNMLDSSERKCLEAEAAMKSKENKLNATISKLETNVFSLNESLANEESEKSNLLDSLKKEKEARMALEKNEDSLRKELGRAEQNVLNANEKLKIQEDIDKRLQEYNSGLQQYNTKLQNDLREVTSAKHQVETEKATILQELGTLRAHNSLLQNEYAAAKRSRDDAVKEVNLLKRKIAEF